GRDRPWAAPLDDYSPSMDLPCRSDFIPPCHSYAIICYTLTALCRQTGARAVQSSRLVWNHRPVAGSVAVCQTG
ncbi:hypothetical protein SK128_008859, partial [Halocaridina rubra]